MVKGPRQQPKLRPTAANDRSDEYIRAQITHSNLKLDITSRSVPQTLAELRRIVECLGTEETFEDLATFEMRAALSDEFVSNDSAMEEVRRLLSMEQQYRIVKEAIPAMEELDFVEGKKRLHVDSDDIKRAIRSLLEPIDIRATKNALIHIKGAIDENERLMITDRIHERIPNMHIRAYQTNQDIEGKILIEAMFFGEYGPEE